MTPPFSMATGESRGGKALNVLGEMVHVKISGAETGERFTIVEEMSPPGGGPPMHLHTREDEWFYVLEGTFEFSLDGKRTTVARGGAVYAPRGIPHTFQNAGAETGKLLIVFQPAGFERFFETMAAASEGGLPPMDIVQGVFEQFGMKLVGSRLAASAAE